MLTCKEAAELATGEDFEKLPWLKRVGLRLHMVMCSCPHCGAFGEQIKMFRDMARTFQQRQESALEESDAALPQEAKDRIVQRLKQ